MEKYKYKKAFTLIELLTVVSILGLLMSAILVSTEATKKKARDAKRYANINVIKRALDIYYVDNNQYPEEVGAGDFEYSYTDPDNFLSALVNGGYLQEAPVDPVNSEDESMYYFYKRYVANEHGCDVSFGHSYILGVINLETLTEVDRPNSKNYIPSCGDYLSLDDVYDYLVGDFE